MQIFYITYSYNDKHYFDSYNDKHYFGHLLT